MDRLKVMEFQFRRWFQYAPAFCLVLGAAAAAYLTHISLRYWATGMTGHRLCSFSEWINCDASSASEHAFFLGVPVAWLGLVHYVSIAALLGIGWFIPHQRRSLLRATMILSALGIGVSIYLAVVMLFFLKTICPPCVLMQMISLALFVSLLLKVRAESQGCSWPSCGVWVAAVFGLQSAGMAGVLEHKARLMESPALNVAQEIERHFANAKMLPRDFNGAGNRSGVEVEVVCFTDYQCPECRRLAVLLPLWMGLSKPERRLTYLNFPLDPAVNRYKPKGRHLHAGIAAKTAIALQEMEIFGTMHQQMLRDQSRLDLARILNLAAQAGVATNTLARRMASPDVAQALHDQIEMAHAAGVSATPAVFINQRRVNLFYEPAVVRGIIKAESSGRTLSAVKN